MSRINNIYADPALADDAYELKHFGPLGAPPTKADLTALHPDLIGAPKRTLRCGNCRAAGHTAKTCIR